MLGLDDGFPLIPPCSRTPSVPCGNESLVWQQGRQLDEQQLDRPTRTGSSEICDCSPTALYAEKTTSCAERVLLTAMAWRMQSAF